MLMNSELFQSRLDFEQNFQGLHIVGILDGVFIVLCIKAVEKGPEIESAVIRSGKLHVIGEGEGEDLRRSRGNGYTRARNGQYFYNAFSFYLLGFCGLGRR
jgi:hypothetical protein